MKYLKYYESLSIERVLIIHGYGTNASECFYPWIKNKLISKGFDVELPNLPNDTYPKASDNIKYILNGYPKKKDIIIAHSLGVPTALKMIENLDYSIKSLYLIAGFIDTNFYDGDPDIENLENFCDWKFNFNKIKNKVDNIYVLKPNKDTSVTFKQTLSLSEALDVPIINFRQSGDHACGSVEPEILRIILKNEEN